MSKQIIYRLNVYVTMALTEDAESVEVHTLETATSAPVRRDLERHIFNTLKHADYACDCELMDFTVEDE